MLSTYAPIYFRRIFGFAVETTGVLISLTTVVQLPFKLVAAYCSDRIVFLSETVKMNIFNTIAVGVVGVIFCVVGFIPLEFKWVAVIMFSLLHALSSCNCGGFYKCGTLHARQHAHVVIATIQFMKCIALFTGPALVNVIVEDESNKTQWAVVFAISGAVMISVNRVSSLLLKLRSNEVKEVERSPLIPSGCATRPTSPQISSRTYFILLITLPY
ncbi:hypothetical protein TELCIR_16268 [Teladorsagia circumcincta]|uniref:Major facilitator superfamily associated domain-containing protein n=1 Tax=Teladorsagia circumcincta TaxID=45464 RepID=A0A2G9TW87_TELCI|nr:hypothetical protein TELCIR_16268 [Teladorsagia circumcincta]